MTGQAQADAIARYNLWLAQIGTNQVDTCRINGSPTTQPRWTGTVSAEYSHPVGFGQAFIRGFVSWKGFTANDPVNPNDSISAYALVDLFAGIRGEKSNWEATVFAKNLFNVRKLVSRGAGPITSSISAVGTSATYNYSSIRLTDPREVGVTLRYSFGSR